MKIEDITIGRFNEYKYDRSSLDYDAFILKYKEDHRALEEYFQKQKFCAKCEARTKK